MWRRFLFYSLILTLSWYLFFLYDTEVLGGVVIFVMIYPFISWLSLHVLKKQVEVGFGRMFPIGESEKQIRVPLQVTNRSRIYGTSYVLEIQAGNRLTSQRIKTIVRGRAKAGSQERVVCLFQSRYCGNIVFELRQIRIYDFLGFFSCAIKLEEERNVEILPQYRMLPVEVTRRTREFISDADEHSLERSGDDPSEIYQIREYADRDSMHDVHWKLTAKEGKLMVKEHGFPLGCVVLVKLDLSEERVRIEEVSQMLENAASLAVTLVEMKCIHMYAWYEKSTGKIRKFRVSNEEQAQELIQRLMFVEAYPQGRMVEIAWEDAFKGDNFSSIVTIDLHGNIIVNGEKQELLKV